MAQEIVQNYLLGFYNSTYPMKTPSGNLQAFVSFAEVGRSSSRVCPNFASQNSMAYLIAMDIYIRLLFCAGWDEIVLTSETF